jgi:hypothetical protein
MPAWYKKKQLLTSLTAFAFLSTRASHKRNLTQQDTDSTDTSRFTRRNAQMPQCGNNSSLQKDTSNHYTKQVNKSKDVLGN